MDRYGDVYLGFDGNLGKSITTVTVILNGGFTGSATDDHIPDQANLTKFLTELSAIVGIGILGDIVVNISRASSLSTSMGLGGMTALYPGSRRRIASSHSRGIRRRGIGMPTR
jgi:hypothetical protein